MDQTTHSWKFHEKKEKQQKENARMKSIKNCTRRKRSTRTRWATSLDEKAFKKKPRPKKKQWLRSIIDKNGGNLRATTKKQSSMPTNNDTRQKNSFAQPKGKSMKQSAQKSTRQQGRQRNPFAHSESNAGENNSCTRSNSNNSGSASNHNSNCQCQGCRHIERRSGRGEKN